MCISINGNYKGKMRWTEFGESSLCIFMDPYAIGRGTTPTQSYQLSCSGNLGLTMNLVFTKKTNDCYD